MKEGYFVTRTYRAGKVCEKIKYWVPGQRPSRVGRSAKAEMKKQEQNETQTIRAAARLLNENFFAGDILLGLDYSDKGLERLSGKVEGFELLSEEERMEKVYESAEHEMKLFLRRVKRECDGLGIELRYAVAVTSDMDGKTGEYVRVHHHIVINREALDAALKKWTLGGVNYSPLSAQLDYTPIAEYLIKQTRKIKDAKRFVSSRNLRRPEPKDRIVPSSAELRVPKGGVLLHRNEFKPGRPQYIRYLVCENTENEKRAWDICANKAKRGNKLKGL